jgi:transposase IS66 family protein
VRPGTTAFSGGRRQAAELVLPLYDLMKRRVLASRVIHTDDTPVEVLDPSLPHTRTGRFWTYVGDRSHPYVVYDYTPSRKRDGPAEFLNEYEGYLQADAFGGYDGIYTGSAGKIIEVGCWAHARRKFFEAKETAPAPSHEALARIGQLYTLERQAQEAQLSATQIQSLRQEKSLPLLASFRPCWMPCAIRHCPKVPSAQQRATRSTIGCQLTGPILDVIKLLNETKRLGRQYRMRQARFVELAPRMGQAATCANVWAA